MDYERWAKVFNVKQMAQTYNYLREHGLLDYGELEDRAAAATERYHALSAQIKAAETRMAEIAVLKTHIINYAKTRDVYAGYRKAGYSKKYLAEHEGDILLHKAAKKAFDDLGVKKLPTVKSLQEEYAKLLAEKKAAYAAYRRSRDEMRELLLHKQNVDRFRGAAPDKQRAVFAAAETARKAKWVPLCPACQSYPEIVMAASCSRFRFAFSALISRFFSECRCPASRSRAAPCASHNGSPPVRRRRKLSF